jgi:hypothetical protein
MRHLVAGIGTLQREPQSLVLNVCTGRGKTILMPAGTLGMVTTRAPKIRSGTARAGDIRISLDDPSEAIRVLGLQARVDLAVGLATLLPMPEGQLVPDLSSQNSQIPLHEPTGTMPPVLIGKRILPFQ